MRRFLPAPGGYSDCGAFCWVSDFEQVLYPTCVEAYCRGPRSDVGGENDYRISEIDLAPRTVGEVSLVKICNRVLKTSGWAFSISSNRTTE